MLFPIHSPVWHTWLQRIPPLHRLAGMDHGDASQVMKSGLAGKSQAETQKVPLGASSLKAAGPLKGYLSIIDIYMILYVYHT